MHAPRPIVALCLLALAVGAPAAVAQTREGGNGPDVLTGTARSDALDGMGGNDRIFGKAGDDALRGDTGGDGLSGAEGSDDLNGGSGNDTIDGGAGNDTMVGDFGDDAMAGGPGDDTIDSGPSADAIDGGPGNDVLVGGSAPDRVLGGDGDDQIFAGTGADVIDAGAGDDVVHANDTGADASVDCGPGTDVLLIDPYATPGGISDSHLAAEGCETVQEQAAEVDPLKGVVWMADGPFGAADKVGGERNDNLLGNHSSNRIEARGGDDVLWGDHLPDDPGAAAQAQEDVLDGGPGADRMFGGRGTNVLIGGDGDDDMQGGAHRNTIDAGPGDDAIRLRSAQSNVVDAGPGDDTIRAIVSEGTARVDCGAGRDVVTISATRTNGGRVDLRGCEVVQRG